MGEAGKTIVVTVSKWRLCVAVATVVLAAALVRLRIIGQETATHRMEKWALRFLDGGMKVRTF